jgi:hypothetical protein
MEPGSGPKVDSAGLVQWVGTTWAGLAQQMGWSDLGHPVVVAVTGPYRIWVGLVHKLGRRERGAGSKKPHAEEEQGAPYTDATGRRSACGSKRTMRGDPAWLRIWWCRGAAAGSGGPKQIEEAGRSMSVKQSSKRSRRRWVKGRRWRIRREQIEGGGVEAEPSGSEPAALRPADNGPWAGWWRCWVAAPCLAPWPAMARVCGGKSFGFLSDTMLGGLNGCSIRLMNKSTYL